MTQKTLPLFQLFLALFASYTIINDFPNESLIVPLVCLVCMLFLGKHDPAFEKSDDFQKGQAELCVNT